MTVFETLQTLGLPIVYGAHTERIQTPYLLLTGGGQLQAPADDTYYWKEDLYQLEYYFTDKDPEILLIIQNHYMKHVLIKIFVRNILNKGLVLTALS